MDCHTIILLYSNLSNMIIKTYKNNYLSEYNKIENILNNIKNEFVNLYNKVIDTNEERFYYMPKDEFYNELNKLLSNYKNNILDIKREKSFLQHIPATNKDYKIEYLERLNFRIQMKYENLLNELKNNQFYNLYF